MAMFSNEYKERKVMALKNINLLKSIFLMGSSFLLAH